MKTSFLPPLFSDFHFKNRTCRFSSRSTLLCLPKLRDQSLPPPPHLSLISFSALPSFQIRLGSIPLSFLSLQEGRFKEGTFAFLSIENLCCLLLFVRVSLLGIVFTAHLFSLSIGPRRPSKPLVVIQSRGGNTCRD